MLAIKDDIPDEHIDENHPDNHLSDWNNRNWHFIHIHDTDHHNI